MTVEKLRRMLGEILDELDCYEPNDEVKTYSNTYFVRSNYCLMTSDGFIDLRELEIIEADDEEEEE